MAAAPRMRKLADSKGRNGKSSMEGVGTTEDKFTFWLAVHDRLWAADRRFRHGQQNSPLSIPTLAAQGGNLIDWWLQARQGHCKLVAKGIDSSRNDQVFNNNTTTPGDMMQMLLEDARTWTLAGAQHLATIGWPGTSGLGVAPATNGGS
ncbi:hypothetical protein HU200_022289 [Digitaria exilis]|uniref:Uncharacterized protein n=1 Tax=Digitaria exilis TaxID=1010633 RepID=A0A835EYS2_9POAL|nr:hypothetical protein HU200_022289 [Digitaria exilis]